ncbi:MAG: DUF721 domain-containing protein [Treponema sp.]|nr:DUF721 domain-containing protein [Treponema sp.]
MIRVGELLGLIIDEKIIHKAHQYSKLFNVWAALTKKHGIAAAADHSQIRDICKNILFIDADHPGWIQILQTKEHKLLEDLQSAFPDLGISGIAFKLSRTPLRGAGNDAEATLSGTVPDSTNGTDSAADGAGTAADEPAAGSGEGEASVDNIKDEGLKAALKSLEQSINQKTKKPARGPSQKSG